MTTSKPVISAPVRSARRGTQGRRPAGAVRAIGAALAALLAGCAALPAAAPPAGVAAATAGVPAKAPAAADAATKTADGKPAAAPQRPDPSAPKPFAEVIRDATRSDGFLPVWRKDDQVWLEIPPDRLDRVMLMTANITSAIGEKGLYAGQMRNSHAVELRLLGKTLQVVARNFAFRGDGDPAMRRTVAQSFSDSLVASTAVASAPHPESKAILVDAGFLKTDLVGLTTSIEAAFRLPYALDRGNSSFEQVRATPRTTALTTRLHFATPRLPAPPAGPTPPGAPRPQPPSTTPDPRSFFVGVIVNFSAMPEQPMRPRRADPRVGYFTEAFSDLSTDVDPNPRVHYLKRWRLEKKDPAAPLSEPVRPIVFWLDRNIPARYRGAVTAGILEWNKAFEKIGFKDALVARQQPDDADWDTLGTEHASIRWFTGADVGFARGPSHADPRTGEILDADIAMSDVFGRGGRRFIAQDVGMTSFAQRPALDALWGAAQPEALCTYGVESAQELAFAMDLLEARGDLEPDSPQAEAFVQARIKDTIMHEVGHVLGLRHNFRASTVVTREQLKDKAFTDVNAIAGSVMDYNAFNIPLAGEPKVNLNVTTLGPYDYWAIEYGYSQVDPATEAEALGRIAARSTDPLLAFADDGDAGGFGRSGIDPRDNRFDLGDDPLAWAQRRLALSRELWDRMQQRGPRLGDDPQRLRRSVVSGFRQLGRVPEIAGKYVGGMYVERDLPGAGRPTYRPVEPGRQREALRFLTAGLFSVDSFRFQPQLLTSLGVDFIEWRREQPLSVPDAVLGLQKEGLDILLDGGTAQRLLDLPYYLPERERAGVITLSEVYTTLQGAVWSELQAGGEIDPLRRNLQREHLRRLQTLLTRPPASLPADALSLARLHAGELQTSLRKAAAQRGLSVETRAHLQDSLGLLTEALRATMQRVS